VLTRGRSHGGLPYEEYGFHLSAIAVDKLHMSVDDLIEREVMLNRFRKLMTEIARGSLSRNTFREWEIVIMLDLEAVPLDPRRREDILRQYVRAVERQLDVGPGPPMKFSEFLDRKSTRRPLMENSPAITMRIASE
jgi:hypothetical protein